VVARASAPTARIRKTAPIALLTDFGYRDHYVGVMKGVIAAIAPSVQVIDLNHGIPPQSVSAGAIALAQSWRYFPERTIFAAIVDPGVGTTRRAIAIETAAGTRFVGPDNGILWPAADAAGVKRIVEITNQWYRLERVSATFHGRDIFAPAAAHLARGVRLDALGPKIDEIVKRAIIPAVIEKRRTLVGTVIYVDGFGNLVTNIDRGCYARFTHRFRGYRLSVKVDRGASIELYPAYGDAPAGAALATFGSFEMLEVAVRDGSAAARFAAEAGAPVTVRAVSI
jgi:S-adenosyl-L-methionine hydrolase (adenosine-forming)